MDNFEKWHKKMFEGNEVDPPEELWSNINDSMESEAQDADSLEQWHRKMFAGSEENPPGEIWEEVETRLDLDRNWDIISRFLKRDRYRYYASRIAVAATLLLLLTLGLYSAFHKESADYSSEKTLAREDTRERKNSEVPKDNGTFPPSAPKNKSKIKGSENSPSVKSTENKQQNSSVSKAEKLRKSSKSREKLLKSLRNKEKDEPVMPGQNNKDSFMPSSRQGNSSTRKMERKDLEVMKPKRIQISSSGIRFSKRTTDYYSEDGIQNDKGHWYAGLVSAAYNSWLMNYETLEAFQADKSNDASFTLAGSYGINGGYQINRSTGIEATLNIRSGYNQNQFLYREGNLLSKQIHLEYAQLGISVISKTHTGNIFGKELRRGFVLGVYSGVLTKEEEKVQGESLHISGRYRDFDLGLKTGYRYELALSPHWKINMNLEAKGSVLNAYNGEKEMPADFKTTHLASIGVAGGVSYIISQ